MFTTCPWKFLTGRYLGNNLLNLTAYKEVKEALEELNIDLNAVEDQERDPALGNGGLGRLAACFLTLWHPWAMWPTAAASVTITACSSRRSGTDIRWRVPDNWLKNGYPFELKRPEYAKEIKFGGYVRVNYNQNTGRNDFIQEGYQSVRAIPMTCRWWATATT